MQSEISVMKVKAFHNQLPLQKEFLDRVQGHYDADEIIHGVYWERGKGCAIGCMVHSNQHKDLESLYGIPVWIGRLVEVLFEGMENKFSKEFVLNFAKTISKPSFLGFDNWSHVYHLLGFHILEKECKHIDHPLVKQPIHDIMILHKTEETDKEKWTAAASAAESAARSVESVESVESVAWSAWSAAWSAAESTAGSAAGSAAISAGYAAGSAAGSAAMSAGYAAGSAAEAATYKSIADKLLELLQE